MSDKLEGKQNEKPTLFLVKEPTAEDLAALYEQLTGRESSPEEIESMRAILTREKE
jgi:hypothetical protein